MLSYRRLSTGHGVIRVCFAVAATQQHEPGHRHMHIAKVTVAHSYRIRVISIVGLTRASFLLLSQITPPLTVLWCTRAGNYYKRRRPKWRPASFYLWHTWPSLIIPRPAGICWEKSFLLSLKALHVFDIYLSCSLWKTCPRVTLCWCGSGKIWLKWRMLGEILLLSSELQGCLLAGWQTERLFLPWQEWLRLCLCLFRST